MPGEVRGDSSLTETDLKTDANLDDDTEVIDGSQSPSPIPNPRADAPVQKGALSDIDEQDEVTDIGAEPSSATSSKVYRLVGRSSLPVPPTPSEHLDIDMDVGPAKAMSQTPTEPPTVVTPPGLASLTPPPIVPTPGLGLHASQQNPEDKNDDAQ